MTDQLLNSCNMLSWLCIDILGEIKYSSLCCVYFCDLHHSSHLMQSVLHVTLTINIAYLFVETFKNFKMQMYVVH